MVLFLSHSLLPWNVLFFNGWPDIALFLVVQIRNLKLIMVAAANAAASRFGEIAGSAVGLEGGDYSYDDKDEMFKMFDKNQDGVISVEEFREVIAELGADEGDALELMQIVDLNTDGSVSSEEFSKFRNQVVFSPTRYFFAIAVTFFVEWTLNLSRFGILADSNLSKPGRCRQGVLFTVGMEATRKW